MGPFATAVKGCIDNHPGCPELQDTWDIAFWKGADGAWLKCRSGPMRDRSRVTMPALPELARAINRMECSIDNRHAVRIEVEREELRRAASTL